MSKKAITFKGTPTVEMQFGAANICVGIGQNKESRNPVVTFHPTSTATKIGGTCVPDQPEPSVIMEFSSIKAIETVEYQLLQAKMILIEEFLNR